MSGGQQITVSQGAVKSSLSSALGGAAASVGQGSLASKVVVGLRSNKTSQSAPVDEDLAGVAMTAAAGTLRAKVARALTGQAITVSRGSVSVASLEPEFSGTIPAHQFVDGTASSFDVTPYMSNFDSDLHQIALASGTLHDGLSIDPTGAIDYDGVGAVASASAYTLQIIDTASADRAARFTAPGVVLADSLGTSTKFNAVSTIDANNWILDDDEADHVTFDSTIKPDSDTGGSLKFDVLSADGSNSGNFGVYFGNLATFGNGDTVWYSYRVRADAIYWFQAHTVSSADESIRGQKISIMSDRLSSSRANETVIQMTHMGGIFNGYHQSGSSFPPEDVNAATNCSGTDLKWQGLVDNGSNPLSGQNIDTGEDWEPCEQDRKRYGGLYSAQSADNWMRGLGDPFTGGFRPVPGEWVTITCRVIVGTFGTASSRFTAWAAHEGEAYVKLWDSQNITLGAGEPDYNCLWLLPYCTNRNPGGRKWTSKTNNIGGITIHTVGTSTPTGDGTLEYNASTGRFRWQSSGGSYGTARGYSVANDILFINVTDGTERGIVVEVTNPAALPSSGTVTDTVTIASGRFDTQVNYCDVIISTSAINAVGGHVPS